jgi:hypothetical protein
MLAPIMSDKAAEPECSLKLIHCKCKHSSREPSGTDACSCRNNELKFVMACGDCRGELCTISEEIEIADDVEA